MDRFESVLAVFQALMVVVMGLVGFILNSFSRRITTLESGKVSDVELSAKLDVIDEKFNSIDQRITDIRDYNSEDHVRLEKRLVAMQASVDEIKDCVNKMASKREC